MLRQRSAFAGAPALQAALMLALLLPGIAARTALPEGFVDTTLTDQLTDPTAMAIAPDGRLFICEQGGRVRVVKNGQLLPEPFVTVQTENLGERGLLGAAFHPDFPNEPYLYLYYTARSPQAHNRVSRFTADGDLAVPESEEVILELDNLSSALIHNGGAIHFGEDGLLYIASGDNASGGSAQSTGNLFGKILRIHANGAIPEDNPFFATASGRNRAIWALGLRNPFTFAVERETGRIFINDVGERTWEEINRGAAGANFGWPLHEGPGGPGFVDPIHAYRHGGGDDRGCAIAGAAFYNPTRMQFPERYAGRFFFGDFCGGWIRTLDAATGATELFATGISFPVDIQVGDNGSLYYLARGDGSLHRVDFAAAGAPRIRREPEDQSVPAGGTARFSVEASGDPPLTYLWQRNGQDLPGENSPSLLLEEVEMALNGSLYRCRVRNAAGEALSRQALLTVFQGGPPLPLIELPQPGASYRAGQTIRYRGSATDPEEGDLPARALSWRVDFHHAGHVHPLIRERAGRGGRFKIPVRGETSADVFFRILLTARDSGGTAAVTSVDLRPLTATISLDSTPSGVALLLDDIPVTTPHQIAAAVGMSRSISAPRTATVEGVQVRFVRWSDGSRRLSRRVRVGESGITLRAIYEAL